MKRTSEDQISQIELLNKNQTNTNPNRWKNFWGNQTTPLHRYNNEKWYCLYAQEINLILESLEYQDGSVLETGCGNGALFDYLNINKKDYIGTDISQSLLDIFKTKHSDVNLICTDSSIYTADRKFSLIFSNGVIQYFDQNQLDTYIKNSLEMLEVNGIIILGNVLWKDLRKRYYLKNDFVKFIKYLVLKSLGKDCMGDWYNPSDFSKYESDKIQLHIFGSLFHNYRFSLALKKLHDD